MTNTTTETLSVNGVVLNTYAKNIETLAGRLRKPPLRTANTVVPARHGALWTPNKKYDVSVLSLPMWVTGCDDDGLIAAGRRTQFYANVDALTKLFSTPGLLDIRHTLPDGSVRQCFGEVLDLIDVDTSSFGRADPTGKFAVSITLPYPFWQDVDPTVVNAVPGVGQNTTVVDVSGLNGTAPAEDLVAQITGPCNNPSIDTGMTVVTYGAVLAAGNVLTLDSGLWALTGSGGLAPDPRVLTHSGDARWCVIPANANTIQFKCTGGVTAATALQLTGRRKWMVG